MKLKKGSQAAKDFMAKIRAKKGKTKTKISGPKKATFKPSSKKKAVKKASTHKDTKSHNVNVSVISGTKMDYLNEIKNIISKIEKHGSFINMNYSKLKSNLMNKETKKHLRQSILLAKKYILADKKRITQLKKLI